jgi:glycogen debranching enzyme
MWYCDLDKNGLCVWDSADHSGMDNQKTRAGEFGAWAVEGTDLNCYLVREMKAMAILAERLDRTEMMHTCQQMGEKIWHAVDVVLWDETDGLYYDRNERTGETVRVKSIAGLISLWLEDAAPGKAARLVEDHMLNTQEFWLEYPVAAWSKQEPDYDQDAKDPGCNWRGTTWIPTNYILMHGLMRHGYQDTALDLAYRTFDMVLARNETTREYYNAETGEGKGLDPFWGWSCLAYFMPLECERGYHPEEITEEPVILLAHELRRGSDQLRWHNRNDISLNIQIIYSLEAPF